MAVREVHGGKVRLSVPTRFMQDWVVAHYADRIPLRVASTKDGWVCLRGKLPG
jgi:chromosomal replication initiation ATPase DnaA